jgi:hypothetical protein
LGYPQGQAGATMVESVFTGPPMEGTSTPHLQRLDRSIPDLVCSVVLSHYTSQKFGATDELGKDMHCSHENDD